MNEPLNTNTRIILAVPEGFRVRSGIICNSCGARELCKPKVAPPVCNMFSPPFAFRSPLIGFDDFFNTFRLGSSMYERFKDKVGTVSTLYDKRKSRVIGYARITGVASGTFDSMCKKFAHTNHLAIGRKTPKMEAPAYLKGVLLKNYHTMFKVEDRDTQPFSVIFMERCEEPKFAKSKVA
jgi:hypothetical protein